jgi:hypothetical protein
MPVETSFNRPLTQLTREIEAIEAEVARLKAERFAILKEGSQTAWRLRYLQLAKYFRRPKASMEMWPTMALLVGPCVIGLVLFILMHIVFSSILIALLGLLTGLLIGAGLFPSLLYRPSDAILPSAIAEAETQARLIDARLNEKMERISESNERLKRLVDERRDQIASGKLQKAALLQRPWKSMPDAEWEDFIVEVCRTLGAKVDRIGRAGGEDANLIVDFGSKRVAVMTQGEGHNVTSATIQQARASAQQHHCDSSAVIINRRFTGAAQDFAQRNGCAAIGAGEFPDFVMGKREI